MDLFLHLILYYLSCLFYTFLSFLDFEFFSFQFSPLARKLFILLLIFSGCLRNFNMHALLVSLNLINIFNFLLNYARNLEEINSFCFYNLCHLFYLVPTEDIIYYYIIILYNRHVL